jgi:hypothetical protein
LAMQAICKKYMYNHVHDATLLQDIMKELAGADGVRELKDRPAAGTGTAHSVANLVSYLSAMMHADTDTDYSESSYTATSNSKSYKEMRKPRGRKRHKSKSRHGGRKKDKKGAKKQQEKITCPYCTKFHRIKPHRVSKDKCMWNKKYKGYQFKSICDKLEVAFKPHHKFAADLSGYAERDSNGSESDWRCAGRPNMRENNESDWILVKHKNSPKTKLTSLVNSIAKHNAYGILSHSDDPIPDEEIIYIDPPLTQQDADIHEHRRQRKIAWCQHIKRTLCLLSKSKNLFFDNNITQAEDERTLLAKDDQTNTQCRAIDSAHVKNNKPAIGLAQRGCNTVYSLGMTIGRTLKKISNNKHVRFAKNNEEHLFDNTETPIMITYDSGANGHYISKKDRRKARLPIIRKSTRRVGVANGGVSQAKFVMQLPFKALSAEATQADTFQDFPSSLMSVGKTANNGAISIFTKDGVAVHKETDVLITCKGEPILIGVRNEQ